MPFLTPLIHFSTLKCSYFLQSWLNLFKLHLKDGYGHKSHEEAGIIDAIVAKINQKSI